MGMTGRTRQLPLKTEAGVIKQTLPPWRTAVISFGPPKSIVEETVNFAKSTTLTVSSRRLAM